MGRRTERRATTTSRRRLLPSLAVLVFVFLAVDSDSFSGTARFLPTLGGPSGSPAAEGPSGGRPPTEVLGATENRVAPKDFRLSGSIAAPLIPGARRPLDVVIENSDPYPLEVTSISVTFGNPVRKRDGRANPACRISDQDPNLLVERAFVGSVTVPANRTLSLSALAVPEDRWPLLIMRDLPTNQDACRNSVFPLVLRGRGRVI